MPYFGIRCNHSEYRIYTYNRQAHTNTHTHTYTHTHTHTHTDVAGYDNNVGADAGSQRSRSSLAWPRAPANTRKNIAGARGAQYLTCGRAGRHAARLCVRSGVVNASYGVTELSLVVCQE